MTSTTFLLWAIYIADRTDAVSGWATFFAIVFFFVSGLMLIVRMDVRDADRAGMNKMLACTIPTFIFCTFVSALTPNKQAVYMMGGVLVAADMLDSDEGKLVRQLLRNELQRMVDSRDPNKGVQK